MTKCYVCAIPELENIDIFRNFVPKNRIDFLQSKPLNRQLESLSAEAILRIKLAEKFKISPLEIEIFRDENGCPHCSLCKISIAHTSGAVAVAFSDFDVGADIEKLRKPRLLAAKKLFTDNEMSYFEENSVLSFWEIWTKKEAFAKSKGTGLSSDLKFVDTISEPFSAKFTTKKMGEFVVSVYSEVAVEFEFLSDSAIFASSADNSSTPPLSKSEGK